MNTLSSRVRRIAAVAIAVCAAAFAASPAMANSSFGWSFSFGTPQPYVYSPAPVYVPTCMTNQSIQASLRHQGYSNIRFLGETYHGYPEFHAANHNTLYRFQVNRCTGQMANVQIVRQAVQPPVVVYGAPQPQGFTAFFNYRN